MIDEGAISGAGKDPLRFAEKLLAILDTGRFTATYKCATLTALIDVCVESVGASGTPPRAISARGVGRRVLDLFWRQSIPYEADLTERKYLRHSTRRGDLVSKVTSFRERRHLGPGVPIEVAQQLFPREFADLEDHVRVFLSGWLITTCGLASAPSGIILLRGPWRVLGAGGAEQGTVACRKDLG